MNSLPLARRRTMPGRALTWAAVLCCCLCLFSPLPGLAQGNKPSTPPGLQKQKKKAKLPPVDLSTAMLAAAQFNFSPSGLKGVALTNPTSLQFGPDNRLYVAEQSGLIKAFTIARSGTNNYQVTATEVIRVNQSDSQS